MRSDPRTPSRSARAAARRQALEVLYQADLLGQSIPVVLARLRSEPFPDDTPEPDLPDPAPPASGAEGGTGDIALDWTATPPPAPRRRRRKVTVAPPPPPEPDPYTVELVMGVDMRADELDARINTASEHWSVPRMPLVDRNVLRLAVYELLHVRDVTAGSVISQAVELAKLLSTDDSGRFVNGVLESIRREVARQRAEDAVAHAEDAPPAEDPEQDAGADPR